MVIPTYEQVGTKESAEAEVQEEETEAQELLFPATSLTDVREVSTHPPNTKSTKHLIERAIQRLVRAGGRETEGDAPHLLEAISVVVYDPTSSCIDTNLPPPGSSLRWDEFVHALVTAYKGRFED
jgi:hypothetical protein